MSGDRTWSGAASGDLEWLDICMLSADDIGKTQRMSAMFLHYTHPDNIEGILAAGLEVGRPPVQGKEVEWVLGYYDENPVYLTEADSNFIEAFLEEEWTGYASFEVDTSGLPLAADIVSLVDMGARFYEGWLDLRHKAVFKPLLQFADENGFLEIEHLIDPATDAAREAIKITKTAACLVSVPPSRLNLQQANVIGAGLPTP